MEKKYFSSIDLIRAIAIIAVVGIHTTTQTFAASGFNVNGYTFTIFLNQIFRFAVPLFFAISGFSLTVSYKKGSLLGFYKKRIFKIAIPYLFWSIFYYFFIYKNNSDTFFESLQKGNASYQLYFIPSLLILYLIYPFLINFYDFLKNKIVIIPLAIVQFYLLYVEYFIKQLEINHAVKIALLNFFIFLLGIIAANNYKQLVGLIDKYKIFVSAATVFMSFYVFFEGSGLYVVSGDYLDIYSQWRPSVLVYTILIGSLLFYFFEKYNYFNNFLSALSKYSFFIYFIHIAVLELVWHSLGKYYYNYSFFDAWFLAAVLVLSMIVGTIVHKSFKLNLLTG